MTGFFVIDQKEMIKKPAINTGLKGYLATTGFTVTKEFVCV